ncbi:MAG: TlpA family protein disulfide reductase [Nocardioides sp.]|nr:TlpA family protein disulfide reductase [Nocardioides sp.]
MTPRPLRVLLVVLLALVLAGCSGLQGTEGKDYVGGSGQVIEIAPDERGAPVESSGDTVDGEPIDVASYRGQPLVVNVWWSGCGPCIKEMPMLVEVERDLAGQAAVIGVNIRDPSPEQAASFERDLGVDYPSLYSPGGTALLDFSDENVAPRAIPSTMVLDRDGRLAALITGEIPTKQTLVSVVDQVVAEAASAAGRGASDG